MYMSRRMHAVLHDLCACFQLLSLPVTESDCQAQNILLIVFLRALCKYQADPEWKRAANRAEYPEKKKAA